MSAIRDYLNEIQNEFNTGIAGEHAYRPALKKLLESFDAGLNAVNDPARTEIGMPDFVVLRQPGDVPIGIVEAKDIGNQLSRTENSKQLKRYRTHSNLILTNYLEFRWYVSGDKWETVRIANVRKGKIVRNPKAYNKLNDLLRRFAEQTPSNVNNAKELAERLASIAKEISYYIEQDLKSDSPSANLANQMQAFQKTLLPGLDKAKFSDMFAQTLVYGLFAARMNHAGNPAQFSLGGAAQEIPQTNPFLRRLFYFNSFDLGRRLTWLVEGVVEILRHTDIDSILDHFGKRTQQTDPVVHFYETFLSAYNPSLREKRGVYYTPEPVVKYIVRSVDHILKTRFARPLGLADKDTLILDPAVGTGTFLYHVIEQIKERFEGQQGLWKSYVEERLLPRIFGFELLMAPYTVAHMNLSLQLKDAGYEFKEGERLGIYLTNSLEEGIKEKYESAFGGFIEEEANAAAEIKRDKPIMVVLGNPPYSYDSQNKGEWIRKLVRDYYFADGKPLGERNPKGLQDDYVKFLRFAQWRIEQSGEGVVAFVTNHTFLDGPTFRGMRQTLLTVFDHVWILDLHGNTKRHESSPDGSKDENVFDIQQGVSIVLLVKEQINTGRVTVHHFDLWGIRTAKYLYLESQSLPEIDWQKLEPVSPQYSLVPRNNVANSEYEASQSLTAILPTNVRGFTTHRDHFAVDYDESVMLERARLMRNANIPDSQLYEDYSLKDSGSWNLSHARTEITRDIYWKDKITVCSYRPFDNRYCFFSKGMMDRPRKEITRHVFNRDNLCLLTTRQQINLGFRHVFCVESPAECCVISNRSREGNQVFPLYLYREPQDQDADFEVENDESHLRNKPVRIVDAEESDYFDFNADGRRPNLSKSFVNDMESKLGLRFETEKGSAFGNGDAPDWFGPEDVFYYAYAVFHSPTYRERYAEFLKIDFPRLPLTSDVDLFGSLVELGAELVSLHLMKSSKLNEYMTTFDKEGDDEVARGYPKYTPKGGLVHINKTQYFGGVPQEIWDFHIGGYQMLHKWLKDRRGRKLSLDEKEHYQKIVVALSETIRIMTEIDAAIPQFPIE